MQLNHEWTRMNTNGNIIQSSSRNKLLNRDGSVIISVHQRLDLLFHEKICRGCEGKVVEAIRDSLLTHCCQENLLRFGHYHT